MLRYVLLSNKKFNDINPLDCGEETCDKDFVRSRRFPYTIFHFAFSGSGVFEIEGVRHNLHKGQMSVVKPNESVIYSADKTNPWHYAWIGFEANIFIPKIGENAIIDIPQAERIFKDLISADKIAASREYFVCAKIYELISLLSKDAFLKEDIEKDLVESAKNYMNTNYPLPLSVEQIAKTLSISKSYFFHLFKKHTDRSPYKYLLTLRLEKAAELMTIYNESAKAAAYAVGFGDLFTFSKAFKAHFKIPPTKWKGQI